MNALSDDKEYTRHVFEGHVGATAGSDAESFYVPVCPLCGHEWRRHDPEDGECDAFSTEIIGVCQCGRDLAWMRGKIAALSTAALGGDGG
jgi:hypothetical protein